MNREETNALFAAGLVLGVLGTLFLSDVVVSLRRARAEQLRARARAWEAEAEFLQRAEQLAHANVTAAA